MKYFRKRSHCDPSSAFSFCMRIKYAISVNALTFFTFFELYIWYQITQSVSYIWSLFFKDHHKKLLISLDLYVYVLSEGFLFYFQK